MPYDQTSATAKLRAELVDSTIKQISNRKYKFKQAVTVVTTGAWKNTFWREKQGVLTGKDTNLTKGIPRGADFPHAFVELERIQSTIDKYGLEGYVDYEDLISDEVDVRNRTLVKLAEGVTKAVDDEIYNVLTESDSPVNINSFQAYAGWNQSSAAIIDDLGQAEQLIAQNDYDTDNLMVFINPRDKRSVVKYLTDKGAQFPKISEEVATNGKMLKLVNYDFVVSRSVAASRALVVIPKRCATWRQLDPLQTHVIEDKGKRTTIRVWEMGTTQLTDPKAVCLITHTQIGA